MTVSRCKSSISLGWYPGVPGLPHSTKGLYTRCMLEDDGHTEHVGKGLAQFDYQRWTWFTGDRRTYESDRSDERAWEIT
jgi:hypothetical protein